VPTSQDTLYPELSPKPGVHSTMFFNINWTPSSGLSYIRYCLGMYALKYDDIYSCTVKYTNNVDNYINFFVILAPILFSFHNYFRTDNFFSVESHYFTPGLKRHCHEISVFWFFIKQSHLGF
jgi:hypothetical protein